MKSTSKVLIVGAGAAGLSCARELNQAGVDFKIIEARNRIGGRAWSFIQDYNVIEYGAEFIHGAHKEIIDLLDNAHHSFIDVTDHHLYLRNGQLQKVDDFWDQVKKINSMLNPDPKTDRSIADFLKASGHKLSPKLKNLYVSYIEGFQAADTNFIGEKGLAEAEKTEEPELNKHSQFRPGAGYSSVMECLCKEAAIEKSQILFSTSVQRLDWKKDIISLTVKNLKNRKTSTISGTHAVITVPVEVLKRLQISPEIPSLQNSLNTLSTGHVQRITFQFASRFWNDLSAESVTFLHADPKLYFPTWWTQMPIRNSLLTAWQGGPKAYEMSFWSEEKRVQMALKTLSTLTGKSISYLKNQCLTCYTHDWSNDPFSLGAYSYTSLQNEGRQSRLQQDFEDILFIAGEATALGSGQGTIHGAIQSGRRAGRQVLKKLNQ